jgi:spermidine synthase
MLGDARISLARQPDGLHDVMIFDAFNSDAVPVHLLTREAFDLYLRKLSPRGVLAFPHFEPLFRSATRTFPPGSRFADGRVLRLRDSRFCRRTAPGQRRLGLGDHGAQTGDIEALTRDKRWIAADSNVKGAAWTDDYADVLGSLIIAHDVIF